MEDYESKTLIEIPQAVYADGQAALDEFPLDPPYRFGSRDLADASAEVLHAAAPGIVAAELLRLADQLTELAESMRQEDDRGIRAAGLFEGITVIRERAAQLRAAEDGSF